MQFSILTDILFELLSKRKITANQLAEKYGISARTAYRYIDRIAESAPVYVKRGRNGGVYIADNYKLPVGFMTEKEYSSILDALAFAYAESADERFLQARRKLASQAKAEQKASGFHGDVGSVWIEELRSEIPIETLRLIEECILEKIVLTVDYVDNDGSKSQRNIEPHVLVFRKNSEAVYAFCHTERAFRLFELNGIHAALKTETLFRKRPFQREDILSLENLT